MLFLGVSNVSRDFMVQTVPIHVSRGAEPIPVKKILEIVWEGVKMDIWV